MKRKIDIISSIDWLSVILYLILIAFGWMNIFAVNYNPGDGSFFQLDHRYTMQLAWILISFMLVLAIFILDSRFFSFIAYPVYGIGIITLLLVLVIGTAIHSSKSWIVIGPISLQPSEFAKVATILALAKYLSGYNMKITKMKDILLSLVIIFLPAVLIMIQPDFGSTIVYGIFLLVLFREGLPGWVLVVIIALIILFLATFFFTPFVIIVSLFGMAVIGIAILSKKKMVFLYSLLVIAAISGGLILLSYLNFLPSDKFLILMLTVGIFTLLAIIYALKTKIRGLYLILLFLGLTIGLTYSVDFVFHEVMKEHQQHRVNVMLGLESDPYGYEYNVRQSKIAIGSGGFAGKGFLKGTQTKYRFVPEQSTDFIFCTVGEEWGFLGSFGLVIVYVGLLIRLIFLAERQRSKFSRIYGYGVASVLFFHFAVNIGMTIGLFPVIGIPLPFLSYGGSSLMAFTIMLFIFIKLDSSRKTYLI
jgi:rod shape determining protein RodA